MSRFKMLILSFFALPLAQADDSFPVAAAPLFLGMGSFHEQTSELLHLPCVREEGFEPLGKLANGVADLQTIAATETDSYVTEMQKPAPPIGDSCGGSFVTLVQSVDQKRARTLKSAERWTQIAAQMQQASSLILPSGAIRFAATSEAGGGGGAKCVWKAKKLRRALTQAASGINLQFQTVRASLDSTGDQLAIYRQQNAKLAERCGQAVVPDPFPAQSARAASRLSATVASGNSANPLSDITGVKPEDGLVGGALPAKDVAALHSAMGAQRTHDKNAEALTGFAVEGRLQASSKTGTGESAPDANSAGTFESLREVLDTDSAEKKSEAPGTQARTQMPAQAIEEPLRTPASANELREPGSSIALKEGVNLFQRVHARYRELFGEKP